jgi:hypothetical protein
MHPMADLLEAFNLAVGPSKYNLSMTISEILDCAAAALRRHPVHLPVCPGCAVAKHM